jgi:tetratricopeptide (TPR) repeat protein
MRIRNFSQFHLGVCLLLAAVALGMGCTANVSELRADGIEQFRNRQYVESMATFREVLERSPNDAQGNYYMGLNYRASAVRKFNEGNIAAARRELDTAVIYFAQAIKSWPNYMAAVAAKNEALELVGKYDEALSLAERVAGNNRGIAEHYVFLGREYRQRGDYDNAMRAFKMALATDPTSSKAWVGIGNLYAQIGDMTLADDAFRRAYEINKSDPGLVDYISRMNLAPDARIASHEPGQ